MMSSLELLIWQSKKVRVIEHELCWLKHCIQYENAKSASVLFVNQRNS